MRCAARRSYTSTDFVRLLKLYYFDLLWMCYTSCCSTTNGSNGISPEEEKERLRWEGFAEKEGFKSGIAARCSYMSTNLSDVHIECDRWHARANCGYSLIGVVSIYTCLHGAGRTPLQRSGFQLTIEVLKAVLQSIQL